MIERKTVEKTIGKTFADKLDSPVMNGAPALTFTHRQMVDVLGCANFIAAARLSKVLKRLGIKNANQLFHTDPFSLLRSKGIGETAMFVAMCILEHKNFSVEKWWGWNDNVIKFSTFQHKAARRATRRKQEVA